jgi:hypothetical protein
MIICRFLRGINPHLTSLNIGKIFDISKKFLGLFDVRGIAYFSSVIVLKTVSFKLNYQ